jgi:beta-galactosidase/beta-glucuronidase
VLDEVSSYLGLRSAGVGGRAFLLNGLPYYVRSVLGQGYWPESHLAAPDAGALRREVELIKELGFNAVRVHQKVEDPRFLFWADRLGLLVWGETANAFAFSPEAVRRLTTEWLEVVHRDISHPCIVTWVPMNESWGVHDVATDPAQQAYTTALAALTRRWTPAAGHEQRRLGAHRQRPVDGARLRRHRRGPRAAVRLARAGDGARGLLAAGRRVLLPGPSTGGSR